MNILPLSLPSTAQLRAIAAEGEGPYILLALGNGKVTLCDDAVRLMTTVAERTHASLVYGHYFLTAPDGTTELIATIPCRRRPLRDDFRFGPLVMIRLTAMRRALRATTLSFTAGGFYDLCLRMSESGPIVHIDRPVCTLHPDVGALCAGGSQFDYVDLRNRASQIEMEQSFRMFLKRTGAWIDPVFLLQFHPCETHPVEASVIIPVRNRVNTIDDAIRSALRQQTDFPFNVIVVDNHSTDGTTEAIRRVKDDRLIHIVPDTTDLGIGGCWNLAIASPMCGRYAVQLDSDDLYSGIDTLQRIVDTFRSEKCGMVVGSYRLTDFNLNPIPPGVIDHREWTEDNGHNNALRVNGFGAPRAFATELARRYPFPNVNYGEDYAMGLRISREYRVGRIFDVLYLCRRWSGNSDASPTQEQANRNDLYKDSLRTLEYAERRRMVQRLHPDIDAFITSQLADWQETRERYDALHRRLMTKGMCGVLVQFNPDRIRSSAAKVDKESIAMRPCFLCDENRPAMQHALPWMDYDILVNPYPIFKRHLVIKSRRHEPQRIRGHIVDMLRLANALKGYTVFYNGPRCGASAPDHFHFQAAPSHEFPLWEREGLHDEVSAMTGGINPHIVLRSSDFKRVLDRFRRLVGLLPKEADAEEPMFNLFCRMDGESYELAVVPRKAHRPGCFGTGRGRFTVSPGAADVAGMFVTVTPDDYAGMTESALRGIFADVCFDACFINDLAERIKP